MKYDRLAPSERGSLSVVGGLLTALAWIGSSSVSAAEEGGVPSGNADQRPMLEEVVVTAQKRTERLQDVPVPVSAISSETLTDRSQTSFADYFSQVPSVSLNNSGDGQNTVVIRGVTTGPTSNPTVGVTIDDIPFGSSSAYGYGSRLIPDLDPADLSRVEVLRGPQGTLYGAASLGGLIKFITTDPSLDGVHGRAEVDYDSVHEGSEGFGVRGAVSLPVVTGVLGVGISGFKRQDPGFIDDPVQGRQNNNLTNVRGGRLSVLWRPGEWLSVKLGVLAQDSTSSGTDSVDTNSELQPTLGDLAHSLPPGTGGYVAKVRLYSSIVNAKLGQVELVSLTGYGVNEYQQTLQYQNDFFGELAQENFGVAGNTLINQFRTEKFSQEIRLSSAIGPHFDWMVGGFYTHEHTPVSQILTAADPASGATRGQLIDFAFPTTYEEYAAFANLTVRISDQFDIQFGGRESENKQAYNETDSGVVAPELFGENPFVFPEQSTKANAFTYLITPRFKVSPDLMVYARLASGYRPGGNNGEATAFDLPLTFKPDKTQNYEFGLKGSLWGKRLAYDVSVYYIDWKDVQLTQTDPLSGLIFYTNGGKARSDGVELSLQSSPIKGLNLQATFAYNDAQLREDLPITAGYGLEGDRLPFAAKFAGAISADQEVPLTDHVTAFAGTTIAYTGRRFGSFVNPISTDPLIAGVRNELPSYTTVSLRAGARYDAWRISLFVDNVGDKRGLLDAESRVNGSASPTDPYAVTVIRPRTVGLSVSTNF